MHKINRKVVFSKWLFVGCIQFFIVRCVLVLLYMFWKNAIRNYVKKRILKNNAYECGFRPLFYSRLPFSIRFFLILILFIVFDIELSFFLQLPYQYKKFFLKKRVLFLVFFFVLIYGLLEEWRRGVLNWVK